MASNNTEVYGMNLPTAMVIASFVTIAWVNTIELQVRIWIGFKRYVGLYFWSLLLSSWGCALHPLCFLLLDFGIWKNAHVAGVFIGIGWWFMVTGQALVLYSRLHLVVRDKRKIRWVLIMIITNFFILHLPIMILSQTAYSGISSAPRWLKVYNVYEKVQMTGFTIQESIISGLYLWETRKILRPGKIFQKKKTRKVFHHLIWVNIFIILLDFALLATEYAGLFSIQTVFKAAIYSLKLRFEFVVLNALMDIVQGRSSAFDLSANASQGYGTSRSARNMPMDDMNGRISTKDPNTYSVYASKGLASPKMMPKGDGVLKTTEVMIHGTPNSPRSDDIYLNGHRNAHGRVNIASPQPHAMSPPSPTHSEVEFAGKGA
ncbi:dehydrogenase xptC [Physcia stellaris]|nr:dehydrogenase xptC [Physcia stellaris]